MTPERLAELRTLAMSNLLRQNAGTETNPALAGALLEVLDELAVWMKDRDTTTKAIGAIVDERDRVHAALAAVVEAALSFAKMHHCHCCSSGPDEMEKIRDAATAYTDGRGGSLANFVSALRGAL